MTSAKDLGDLQGRVVVYEEDCGSALTVVDPWVNSMSQQNRPHAGAGASITQLSAASFSDRDSDGIWY